MNTYLIALGSNLGDRNFYLSDAVSRLAARYGKVLKQSLVRETAPLGAADQSFLNGALLLESPLDPEAMLDALLTVERELGRVRAERWGNRTIDLDLILWKDSQGAFPVWESPQLSLPHPEALKRDFVLGPAAEIAGDWRHPARGETLQKLWDEMRKT